MKLRGIVSGALLLILLETVVRNDTNATRFGSVFELLADLSEKFISPAVPGIPDRRGGLNVTGDSNPAGGGGGGGGSW